MFRRIAVTQVAARAPVLRTSMCMFGTSRPMWQKYYTETHEWIEFGADKTATIGVTVHAQETLGDVVFVGLPSVGDDVDKKGTLAEIESVKATSDIYTPVKGKVSEVNSVLESAPQTVNEDAEGKGWVAKLKSVEGIEEAKASLMDAEKYQNFVKSSAH
jgi:glycine cleavage system H protein